MDEFSENSHIPVLTGLNELWGLLAGMTFIAIVQRR
jgi:hypothetical protein